MLEEEEEHGTKQEHKTDEINETAGGSLAAMGE